MSNLEMLQQVLTDYDIGEEIGEGAFGHVYAARHRHLGRRVAIKVLDTDRDGRRRFLTEAKILAGLDHPHIVRIFEYREVGDICALVMEYVEGGDLTRHHLAPTDVGTACLIGIAICAALSHAHERRILHRDIKPENVLFSSGGTLKVTDFGIAKVLDSDAALTSSGQFLGTASYVAPEQVLGEPLGPPVDIYATAMLLYQLLSGRLPFPADGNVMSVALRHVTADPAPLAEHRQDLPRGLSPVIMRGLARRPADRFPSAQDFALRLIQAAAELGPGWRRGCPVLLRSTGPILEALLASDRGPDPQSGDPTASLLVLPPATLPEVDSHSEPTTETDVPSPDKTGSAPPDPRRSDPADAPTTALRVTPEASADRSSTDGLSPATTSPEQLRESRGRRRRKRALIVAPAAVVAVAASAIAVGLAVRHPHATSRVAKTTSVGSTAAPTSPPVSEFTDAYHHDVSGVVQIVTDACGGGTASTGFLVGSDLIVTSALTMTRASAVSATTIDGHVRTATLVGADPESGLALLRLGHPMDGHVLNWAAHPPAYGDAVGVIAFTSPRGPELQTAFRGTPQPSASGASSHRYHLDVPSTNGAFGAPTVSADGAATGVVTASGTMLGARAAAKALQKIKADPGVTATTCIHSSGPSTLGAAVTAPPGSLEGSEAVAQTVSAYFSAINAGDFRTAWHLTTSAFRSRTSLSRYTDRLSTTFDEQVRLRSVRTGPAGSLIAWVTFVSLQRPDHAPDGQYVSCDRWSLDLTMSPSGMNYLIDRGRGHDGGMPVECR